MPRGFSIFSFGLVAMGLCAVTLAEDEALRPPTHLALADVDGVKLTLADYGRKHPGGLFQAYQTFYGSERKVVEDFVGEFLMERQAKKEGLTVEQLLDRHVKSSVAKDPSEEALQVYFEGTETEEPFEKVRPQILENIRERRLAKVRNDYLKKLREDAHITYFFGPPRAEISMKDMAVRGPADAPIKIIEFADYECPYCQSEQFAIGQIEEEYKGKIAFAYADMPLPNHTHAQKAAEAVHCAGAQGKFWEYHDMVFKTRALELKQLKEHAQDLKLDTNAFDKCLDSGSEAAVVKAQFTEGVGYGLQGTPAFFINGRYASGAVSVERLRAMIDEEMAISAGRGKETAKQ
jgi:predicted DsbA family dithiol-disulfide isomerase